MFREIVDLTRQTVLEDMPHFLRVSGKDWLETEPDIKGWTVKDTVKLAETIAPTGVDLMDVSSDGLHPKQNVKPGPGYQAVRSPTLPTGVSLLTASSHSPERSRRSYATRPPSQLLAPSPVGSKLTSGLRKDWILPFAAGCFRKTQVWYGNLRKNSVCRSMWQIRFDGALEVDLVCRKRSEETLGMLQNIRERSLNPNRLPGNVRGAQMSLKSTLSKL